MIETNLRWDWETEPKSRFFDNFLEKWIINPFFSNSQFFSYVLYFYLLFHSQFILWRSRNCHLEQTQLFYPCAKNKSTNSPLHCFSLTASGMKVVWVKTIRCSWIWKIYQFNCPALQPSVSGHRAFLTPGTEHICDTVRANQPFSNEYCHLLHFL